MKLYSNRNDPSFFADLRLALSLPQVKTQAVPLSKPFLSKSNKEYHHVIRIDYLGIAGSLLFDVGQNLSQHNVYKYLQRLVCAADQLNRAGYFVRFRILLEYPYSISAYSRIQAESSIHRSSMDSTRFLRKFDIPDSIEEYDGFDRSSYIVSQLSSIQALQELTENKRWKSGKGFNRMHLRFTPIELDISCLFINNTIYYTLYLFAKRSRHALRCEHLAPLVRLEKGEGDNEAFASLEEHFRYLWELESTLDIDDVLDSGVNTTLRIKKPSEIDYHSKSQRRRSSIGQEKGSEITRWERTVVHQFKKVCFSPDKPDNKSKEEETVFIACSWQKLSSGSFRPSSEARLLRRWLQSDFSSSMTVNAIIVEAPIGEWLTKYLYDNLDKSTKAVVIMTKDIETINHDFLCKSNVYYELGYLLKALGHKNTILVCEDDNLVPSNVKDLIRIDFKNKDIRMAYVSIIEYLCQNCKIETDLNTILSKHWERVRESCNNGEINNKEAGKIADKINESVEKINYHI